jgi:hypothetical protein
VFRLTPKVFSGAVRAHIFSTFQYPSVSFQRFLTLLHSGIFLCVPPHAVRFSNIFEHVNINFPMYSGTHGKILQRFPMWIEEFSNLFLPIQAISQHF